MKKFIVGRSVPGVGKSTPEELRNIAQTSNGVITVMGKPYHWIHSFVTDNKIYCIHEAENENDIREHGQCGNFPIDTVEEIKAVIDPTTGDLA